MRGTRQRNQLSQLFKYGFSVTIVIDVEFFILTPGLMNDRQLRVANVPNQRDQLIRNREHPWTVLLVVGEQFKLRCCVVGVERRFKHTPKRGQRQFAVALDDNGLTARAVKLRHNLVCV